MLNWYENTLLHIISKERYKNTAFKQHAARKFKVFTSMMKHKEYLSDELLFVTLKQRLRI